MLSSSSLPPLTIEPESGKVVDKLSGEIIDKQSSVGEVDSSDLILEQKPALHTDDVDIYIERQLIALGVDDKLPVFKQKCKDDDYFKLLKPQIISSRKHYARIIQLDPDGVVPSLSYEAVLKDETCAPELSEISVLAAEEPPRIRLIPDYLTQILNLEIKRLVDGKLDDSLAKAEQNLIDKLTKVATKYFSLQSSRSSSKEEKKPNKGQSNTDPLIKLFHELTQLKKDPEAIRATARARKIFSRPTKPMCHGVLAIVKEGKGQLSYLGPYKKNYSAFGKMAEAVIHRNASSFIARLEEVSGVERAKSAEMFKALEECVASGKFMAEMVPALVSDMSFNFDDKTLLYQETPEAQACAKEFLNKTFSSFDKQIKQSIASRLKINASAATPRCIAFMPADITCSDGSIDKVCFVALSSSTDPLTRQHEIDGILRKTFPQEHKEQPASGRRYIILQHVSDDSRALVVEMTSYLKKLSECSPLCQRQ